MMKNLIGFLVVLVLLAAPASASFESAVNGVNGIATAAFDPLHGLITGEALGTEEFPSFGVLDPVISRFTGLIYGTVTAFVRVAAGAVDVLVSPFTGYITGYEASSPVALVVVFEFNKEESGGDY